MGFMAKKKSAAVEVGESENKIRSVADLVKWVGTIDRDMLYRGLTNKAREVSASICRRLGVSVSEEEFVHASEGMVEQARRRGYARDKDGELKDLQIMANLQHAGAATCLIDFTKSPLVALWFACQPSKDEEGEEVDGKIIAVAGKPPKYDIIGSKNLGLSLKELLEKNHLWRWRPENLNNRIVAQHSEFIFGERAISPDEYVAAVIPADNKIAILRELVKHNISSEHLFPDFEGFARFNAHNRPYKPDYYASLAEKAAQAGEYQRAIHWYDIAVNDWNSPVWLNERGNAKMLIGHLQEAIADFTTAIKLGQEYAKAYSNRGVANHKSGNYKSAIADYDRAIEINPQDAFAYNNRGNTKDELRDYKSAIADFDRALEINPQLAGAYYNRGLAKGKSGDLSGAIADFDRALEINPQHSDSYNNRGLAKGQSGDLSGAMADYNRAIEINPQSAATYNNRGLAKEESGDYKSAIADYDRALEINPQYAEAHYNRAIAKEESGDLPGAIADYDQAIKINPQFFIAYNNRGLAKEESGDYKSAIADFDRAIKINPRFAGAYTNRGMVKGQSGDLLGAIADFDRAIKINPQLVAAYTNRGTAKGQLGDLPGAIADFDRVIKINPRFAGAYHNRGVAKEKSGDKEGAAADLRKAKELEDASKPKKK